jgi:hypothetical protein
LAWEFVFAAVVHALLGLVLFVSWYGLLRRKRWARWMLLLVSGFVALALLIAIVGKSLGEGTFPVGADYFLLIAALFALNTLALSTSSARAWFRNVTAISSSLVSPVSGSSADVLDPPKTESTETG